MQWDDTTAIIFFNGSEGVTLQNLISSNSDPSITNMHGLLQYDVGVNTRGFTMELHVSPLYHCRPTFFILMYCFSGPDIPQ